MFGMIFDVILETLAQNSDLYYPEKEVGMCNLKIFIAIQFLTCGCVAVVKQPLERLPAQSAYEYTADDFTPSPEDLSFQELSGILQKERFSKIEDLLQYLNTHKPEYMSHYSLAFGSRSLHQSSKQNPRAIVYGKRANFIISFNGEPSRLGKS